MEQEIKVKISLKGYWYIGSGQEAGAYADSLMLKTKNRLPYIPGKTLKGIFRNAAITAKENNLLSQTAESGLSTLNKLFGTEGTTITGKCVNAECQTSEQEFNKKDFCEITTSGILCFSNAVLPQKDADFIDKQKAQHCLFRTIQNTKIDSETGTAADGSLRTTEVCVPLNLIATVNYDRDEVISLFGSEDSFMEKFKLLCCLIGEIGGKRRRGFGKCTVEVI